ncbi:MAG TPA: heavy metal translocating P-type ATPase [Bacilli bacterium]|nr:heavy metal translocating P-type ATPase [Bacilli bacterium]
MKKLYDIKGFDCANCALKVSRHLSSDPNIKSASIDFVNEKLYVDYQKDELSIEELKRKAAEVESDPLEIREHRNSQVVKTPILTRAIKIKILRIIISAVLLGSVYFFDRYPLLTTAMNEALIIAVSIISYLLIGYDILFKAGKNLFTGRSVFDETVLMSVATLGAFAIQSYEEAVLVMLLFQIGEIFEDISIEKSRRSIVAALDLRSDIAHVYRNDEYMDVDPSILVKGDVIMVRVGEIIPVDSTVISGTGSLDTSSLTGEFLPQGVVAGDVALSGTVVTDGILILKVEKAYQESTISKIIELVTTSGENKAKAEKFIARFSRFYTPIVMALALLVAIIPPLFNGDWRGSAYTALTFLVVSCPCAIVISVPLAFFTGIGLASKKGIVIKGANYLDRLNEVKTIIYDKTGTLTTGEFSVTSFYFVKSDEQIARQLLVSLESLSGHPLAKAITGHFKDIEILNVDQFHEETGRGLRAIYDGKEVLVGNGQFLKSNHITLGETIQSGVVVYVAYDKRVIGRVELNDTIKPGVADMVSKLHREHVRLEMLTGDRESNAAHISQKIGIDEYHAELLPQDKIRYLDEKLTGTNPKQAVAFIGDGVNDAPSIAKADIGFAMGGIGSDIAVSSADAVIMNDDPLKVATAIKIARITRRRAISNIVIALIVKISVMVLAYFNLAPMWLAVLSDSGLAILLVINSLLLIKAKVE